MIVNEKILTLVYLGVISQHGCENWKTEEDDK